MTVKRLYSADTLFCFAGLTNLYFTKGDRSKNEIEFYLELIPGRMQVFIVPVHELESFSDNLSPFVTLGLTPENVFMLSDTKELSRTNQVPTLTSAILSIDCQKGSLEAFLKQLSTLVAAGQLTPADAAKLQTFVNTQIIILSNQIQTITEKKYFWVLGYNNATMTLEAFKVGDPVIEKKQVILSLPICFIKLINYTDFVLDIPKAFKVYSSLPKIENNKMTMVTLVADKLRLVTSELGMPAGELPFVQKTTKYKKSLSFTPPCSQMDFEFAISYYRVNGTALQELIQSVTVNKKPIFDLDLGLPGINPRAFNASEPDNKPDKDSRIGLGVYFRDELGNYLGTISYRSRYYSNQEMAQSDDKTRIINYLNSVVADAQKGRNKIFTNMPNGPKEENSIFFRHDIKVFTESVADADPILRRIDTNILNIEKIIEQNLPLLLQKIAAQASYLATQQNPPRFPQNF